MRPLRFALLLLGVGACDRPPGPGADGGVDDVPPDLRCGPPSPLVTVAGSFFTGGDATLFSARIEGDAVFELDDDRSIRFAVDADAPPALPALGPVEVRVGQPDCFGEGCDDGWWTLRDVDGAAFFEVGVANTFGRNVRGPNPGDHLTLVVPQPDVLCPSNSEPTPALAVIVADDRNVVLAPGEGADVTIDGVAWRAIAGSATRSSFVQDDDPCADCASPGVHSEVRVEAVLYRVAP